MNVFQKIGLLAFSTLVLSLTLDMKTAASLPNSSEPAPLEGNWQFFKHIYQGKDHAPLNPHLVIQFEFLPDGTNRLFWTRRNEPGFCERRAYFEYDGEYIHQEVYWVNPENEMECGQDTDMQLGHKNTGKLIAVDGHLHLYTQLSGEDFIYVWRKIR